MSPHDTAKELRQKIEEYFAAGTRMVWVFYPSSRTVDVFRSPTQIRVLTADQELDGEDVLPGFSCKVGELFR